MPFTFCHPAVVLPLYRLRFLSMTGLVAGSVAPDFEYFIRMTDKRVYTHTWHGMLWYDLPLALLLTFLFHLVVRNVLLQNAPAFFQKRLLPFSHVNWPAIFKKRTIAVVFSILIGVASHLIWDNFTHENAFTESRLPMVAHTYHLGGFGLKGHLVLQIASSILGALVILGAIWQLPEHPHFVIRRDKTYFWLKTTGIAIAVYCLRLLFPVTIENANREWEDFLIPAIASGLYALVIMALLEKLAAKANRRRSGSMP